MVLTTLSFILTLASILGFIPLSLQEFASIEEKDVCFTVMNIIMMASLAFFMFCAAKRL